MNNITLSIPDHIYQEAQRIAENENRPIETVLLEHLEGAFAVPALPPDEQRELDALANLSDEALWTIAREQMPEAKQKQMQPLMDRNNQGTITPIEYEELSRLVEQGQRLMLRKAQAARLLTERGYAIKPDDMAGA